VCPQCGSSTDVRTARELFDLLGGGQQRGFPPAGQPSGAGPAASEGYAANGGYTAAAQGAARYPELRGCLRDRVIFVDGGVRTVPVSNLTLPVTLTQADAVVTRLR
jgi:hypothetical protein